MTERQGVAAQMSTYPMDVRHLEHLLPHQIRALGPMVDRFVVTIDTHQSRSGRYRVANFQQNLERIRRLIQEAGQSYPKLEFADVDYSPAMQREVSRYFFGVDSIPVKAWDGGPFYAYFFGLYMAKARYVFHMDGDILLGGSSNTWIRDAIGCMEQLPDVLVTAPFPGPPRADGRIFGHLEQGETARASLPWPAYSHRDVSTRVFMIDLQRFKERLGVFPLLAPGPAQRMKSRLLGNPPHVREAEVLMTRTMQQSGLRRIDLLGNAPGFWSLHPPYRSELFYRKLPELVRAVESGNVPDGQLGHYDLNDSMIDWSSAREANRWHRRYWRMVRQRLAG
ncbi:MAG: capsular biosynthesis protein [Proteobacteria bacterium]|nr:capsular biosynthesis protein [Pseudomonadota bacterium]